MPLNDNDNLWPLTEHDAADVVDALGDALPAPGHGDAPLSAPGQRVAGNLGSNLVRKFSGNAY